MTMIKSARLEVKKSFLSLARTNLREISAKNIPTINMSSLCRKALASIPK